MSYVFSLTIAYNGGPLSKSTKTNTTNRSYCQSFPKRTPFFCYSADCSCDPVGSFNYTTCEAYGGQCHCKPGVTGRDCSQCLPEFYGFSNSGCSRKYSHKLCRNPIPDSDLNLNLCLNPHLNHNHQLQSPLKFIAHLSRWFQLVRANEQTNSATSQQAGVTVQSTQL